MKFWGNEFRTTVVCVDSYRDGVLSGRLLNPSLEKGRTFHSLIGFFREMEQILNGMNFPQSFSAARSFRGPPERKAWSGDAVEQEAPQGGLATFAVRVLFRQNASWQGSVAWLEGEREESFRSALELVFLMDSALRNREGEPG